MTHFVWKDACNAGSGFLTVDEAARQEVKTVELETGSSRVKRKLGALLSLVRGVDDKDEIVFFRSKKVWFSI